MKFKCAIVTHGGAGSPLKWSDGTLAAARAGFDMLTRGRTALSAAVEAVVQLEDDPRFNAGTGSRMRIDRRIQMDASIMDSRGRFGAVACIEKVKNPIKVALKVMEETPHLLLAGEGANTFARQIGFEVYDPVTEKAEKAYQKLIKRLEQRKYRAVRRFLSGTVGAVARDRRGNFSAANSTGGTAVMLPGRVGDSPLPGCGIYAGKCGAVVTTGVGEEIMRILLSKRVYDMIEQGMTPMEACKTGVSLFSKKIPVGVIAISFDKIGYASNREMAVSYLEEIP